MLKKIRQKIRKFWAGPVLLKPSVTSEAMHGALDDSMSDDERRHAQTMQAYAQANLDLQWNALQHNLTIMWRTMLIALFSVFVAIAIGIFAVASKPKITVQPAPVTIVTPKQ